MAKEEAIKILNGYMCGKIDPESTELYQAIELVVDILESKPSLPSNLDEAAEEYAKQNKTSGGFILTENMTAFKAGAVWMAGRGENKEGEVLDHDEFIKFSDGTYIDLDPTQGLIPAFKLKDGDKVVVQIRKK